MMESREIVVKIKNKVIELLYPGACVIWLVYIWFDCYSAQYWLTLGPMLKFAVNIE